MGTPFWLRGMAAGLLAACHGGTPAAEPLTLLTAENAPYTWSLADGRVQGISPDIVAELMRRAGVPAHAPRMVPWARAIAVTERMAHTCLLGMERTFERETAFKWIGPIGRLEWVLFARADDKIALARLEHALPYTVGTDLAHASLPLLRAHGLHLQLSSSASANPRKLKLGRIDLWAAARMPGQQLLRDLRIEGIEAVYELAQSNLYLACNHSMPERQADRLNAVLGAMGADGTIGRIYGRHGTAQPPGLAR